MLFFYKSLNCAANPSLHQWRTKLTTLVLPVTILLFCSVSSADQQSNASEIVNDDNLLITEVVLGKYKIASDVFIYTSPEVSLIPLQPLFDALELPISVNPSEGKANGWFLQESNDFDLIQKKRQVIIKGKELPLDTNTIISNDGFDIYVDTQTFQRWFNISLRVDIGQLRILVESENTLPLEAKIKREQKRKMTPGALIIKQLPAIENTYNRYSAPVVDINLGYSTQDPNDSTSANNLNHDGSYSITVNGDLAGVQTHFVSNKSSKDSDADHRLTLKKKSATPKKTMMANVSEFAVGDVFAPTNSLVFSGGEGLGTNISFGAADKGQNFGRRVIEGESPPNWEVELYRNNALIDFQVVGSDGRYRFDSVAVEYGENIFDIKLFGPQGQEETRRQSIRVGNNALPAGKLQGQFNFTNLNQSVFQSDNNQRQTAEQIRGDFPHRDETKTLAAIQYGLSENMSLRGGYSAHQNTAFSGENLNYAELGADFSLPYASLSVLTATSIGNGKAYAANLQSRIANIGVTLNHQHFDDFRSDRNESGALNSDTEVRFTGQLKIAPNYYANYQIQSNYVLDEQNVSTLTNDIRLGLPLFRGRLTITNRYTKSSVLNSSSSSSGEIRYIRATGVSSNIRASINYVSVDSFEIPSANASITWRPTNKSTLQAAVNTDFTSTDNNNLDFSYSKIFENITLSSTISLREAGGSRIQLNAELSLGRDSNKRWRSYPKPQASYGRINAKVFLDNDENNRFSQGDEPIKGVQFEGRAQWKDIESNSDGNIQLTGLIDGTPTSISLDESSLLDPYWRANFKEHIVHSHSGSITHIEIPIHVTAEAEGLLFQQSLTLSTRPLGGIPIIAENLETGETISIITEFDGFYVFEGLSKGRYHLTIDPAALEKLSLTTPEKIYFEADPNNGVTYIDDIILSTQNEYTDAIDDSSSDSVTNTATIENDLQGSSDSAMSTDKR